jgi:hypothetical protein
VSHSLLVALGAPAQAPIWGNGIGMGMGPGDSKTYPNPFRQRGGEGNAAAMGCAKDVSHYHLGSERKTIAETPGACAWGSETPDQSADALDSPINSPCPAPCGYIATSHTSVSTPGQNLAFVFVKQGATCRC